MILGYWSWKAPWSATIIDRSWSLLTSLDTEAPKVGIKADDSLAQQTFALIDEEKKGKLTLTEFWHALRPSVSEVLKVLRSIKERKHVSVETLLRQFDSNGDDKLTYLEFQKMLNVLTLDLDESTTKEVFRHLDVDGDRQLSLRTLLKLQSSQRMAVDKTSRDKSVAEVLKGLKTIQERKKLSVETLIRIFDANEDGKLTFSEFRTLLNALSINADEATAREVFGQLDVDGDGQLSLRTLNALQSESGPGPDKPAQLHSVADVLQALQTIREKRKISVERLIEMFDSDGDGKLTFAEFQRLLSALSLDVEDDTAKRVFARLDLDGDGQLSLRTLNALQSESGPGPDKPAQLHSVADVLQALQTIREKRKISVERLIEMFDSDGDSKLTFAEFQRLLSALSLDVEDDTAKRVFARLDLDGDGQLSLRTLNALQSESGPGPDKPAQLHSVADVLQALQTIREKRKISVERLIEMFDSDGDSKLTFAEFQRLLSALSLDVEDDTAKGAFARLDLDGDGQLSLKTIKALQSEQGMTLVSSGSGWPKFVRGQSLDESKVVA